MIKVTVDYGYDVHSVSITEAEYARICEGYLVKIVGDGFSIEGTAEPDVWIFNRERFGAVHVTTEKMHDIYVGAVNSGKLIFDPDPGGLAKANALPGSLGQLRAGFNAEGEAEALAWQRHRRKPATSRKPKNYK